MSKRAAIAEHTEASQERRRHLSQSTGRQLAGEEFAHLPLPWQDLIARRLDEMPVRLRGNYLRGMTGNSPASAMRAFCLMCVGWVRAEVDRCSDPACPLYPYRQAADSDET